MHLLFVLILIMLNFNSNGDFNVNAMCSLNACFANFIVNNGALQLITEPTRLSNTLDLLIVNDPLTTKMTSLCLILSVTSNHCMVTWRIHTSMSKFVTKASRRNFKCADYNALSQYLSDINWVALFAQVAPSDVNAVWSMFLNVILHAINLFVPMQSIKHCRVQLKYPLYVRQALRHKQALWRVRHQPDKLMQYKAQAARCKRLIKSYHVRAKRRFVNSKSTSAFYRHVRRKLDNSQRIPPIKAANGAIFVKDNDKVEAFNKFFTSVFTYSDPPLHINANSAQISAPVHFSVSAVCQALRRAKPTTSSGPDGIPSVFWANMSNELALPVSIIFSSSYKFVVIPAD